jgi:hypothetical protein
MTSPQMSTKSTTMSTQRYSTMSYRNSNYRGQTQETSFQNSHHYRESPGQQSRFFRNQDYRFAPQNDVDGSALPATRVSHLSFTPSLCRGQRTDPPWSDARPNEAGERQVPWSFGWSRAAELGLCYSARPFREVQAGELFISPRSTSRKLSTSASLTFTLRLPASSLPCNFALAISDSFLIPLPIGCSFPVCSFERTTAACYLPARNIRSRCSFPAASFQSLQPAHSRNGIGEHSLLSVVRDS